MQNNSLEDSGEVIFHPRSQKADDIMSREEMETCPNVSSAPNHFSQSENVNDLLLKAVEIMNRDLAEMKQNIGHELSQIRETSQQLQVKVGALEKNITPIKSDQSHPQRHPEPFPYFGAGENPFRDDSMMNTPNPRVNKNDNGMHSYSPPRAISIKPQTFDGTEDFDEYLSQFKILVDLHRWNYREKSLYLASSLVGNARSVLSELNEDQMRDFNSLVKVLNMRYGSVERSEMYRAQLKNITKKESESLSELAQSIKKLIKRAYPSANQYLLDILALDHFVDALPDPDTRLRLRESRVRDIGEAEIMAIRLETYKIADAQRQRPVTQIVEKSPKNEDQEIISLLKNIQSMVGGNNQNSKPKSYPRENRQTNHKWDNQRNNQNKYNGRHDLGDKPNQGNLKWQNPRWNDYGTQNQNWLNDQASDSRGGSRRPEGISPINQNH